MLFHSNVMPKHYDDSVNNLHSFLGVEIAALPEEDAQTSEQNTYYTWSQHDEELLIKAVRKIGKNWKIIQEAYFRNLSPIQLKNKYYSIRRRITRNVNIVTDSNSNIEGNQQPRVEEPAPAKKVSDVNHVVGALKEILSLSNASADFK